MPTNLRPITPFPIWDDVLSKASELSLAWLESSQTRGVGPSDTYAVAHAKFAQPLPQTGENALHVIEDMARRAESGLSMMNSPRFFGWVIGGVQPVGVAADWLVSAWDQNACMAEATPAAAAIEAVTAQWILELLDLPRKSSVGFVTGGQMANVSCLAAARSSVLMAHGWNAERDGLFGAPGIHVVVGTGRHHTIDRALRMLGIGEGAIVQVATDAQDRMDASSLAESLALIEGPAIVCAQGGQINTGATDPLGDIAAVVKTHRSRREVNDTWLHIDGAIGLWARVSTKLRSRLAGCEEADSWSTDAHKWLNTPYDCGIAIVKDREAHLRAMSMRAEYLEDPTEARAPLDWTPELSRRARATPVYATLRHLGSEGMASLVENSCAMAELFARHLNSVVGCTVLNDVELNQVLVAVDDDGSTSNKGSSLLLALQQGGTCYPTGTTWRGKFAIRFSFCNWQTTAVDVEATIEAIALTLQHLSAQGQTTD